MEHLTNATNCKKETLQRLFQQHAQPLYLELLDKTGSPTLAKKLLKQTFSDAYAALKDPPNYETAWLHTLASLSLQNERISGTDARTVWQELTLDLEGRPSPETAAPANVPGEPTPANVPEEPAPANVPEEPAPANVPEEAVAPVADLFAENPAAPQTPARPRKHAGKMAISLLLSLGIVLCLWAIAGVLMNMQVIPTMDFGYGWFNANLYPLF